MVELALPKVMGAYDGFVLPMLLDVLLADGALVALPNWCLHSHLVLNMLELVRVIETTGLG